MSLKWKLLICLALLTCSCQGNNNVGQSPTFSPTATHSPTPPPIPTPTISGLASAVSTPTPVPTPSPTLLPNTKYPPEVNGLEVYNHRANIFCASEASSQQQPQPSLAELQDFVVRENGQQLVLLFHQRSILQHIRLCKPGFSDCLPVETPKSIHVRDADQACLPNAECPVKIISRQGIYTLNPQGQINLLQLPNSAAFTCAPSVALEKDFQDRLLVHMPIRFSHPPFTGHNEIGYRLVEWDLNTRHVREIWQQRFQEDTVQPAYNTSRLAQKTALRTIYSHNKEGQTSLYYLRTLNQREMFTNVGNAQLEKLELNSYPLKPQILMGIPQPGLPPFGVRQDGRLIIEHLQVSETYPVTFTDNEWKKRQWKPIFKTEIAKTLPQPQSMRVDTQDNLYFTGNHSLWHVHLPTQTLKRLAGTDEAGYQDGSGQVARFNHPDKIDLDAAGNVYVFDKGNLAIRKVTPSGQVTTFYREPVKP